MNVSDIIGWYWNSFGIMGIVIILVLLAIVFRRYFSGLIEDYVFDCGFSFADNFIGGAGLIGLDIGDWIGALFIFFKERKITSLFIAGLVAWEATNFFPFSLIPVVGEGLEFFFNFFPAVTIGRILFNKYGPAKRKEKKLEKKVSLAKQIGLGVSEEEKVLKEVKKLIVSEDPVDALKEAKKSDDEISSKLMSYVEGLISDTDQVTNNIINQNIQAPQEIITMLQQGINESEQLLAKAKNAAESKDFETAIDAAMNAKNTIISAAQQFEEAFSAFQSR